MKNSNNSRGASQQGRQASEQASRKGTRTREGKAGSAEAQKKEKKKQAVVQELRKKKVKEKKKNPRTLQSAGIFAIRKGGRPAVSAAVVEAEAVVHGVWERATLHADSLARGHINTRRSRYVGVISIREERG